MAIDSISDKNSMNYKGLATVYDKSTYREVRDFLFYFVNGAVQSIIGWFLIFKFNCITRICSPTNKFQNKTFRFFVVIFTFFNHLLSKSSILRTK